MTGKKEKNDQQTDDATQSIMSGGNLDQVRDILFGAQKREYEKRFDNLELNVKGEFNELREEMRSQFRRLENFIKAELEAVDTRLRKEQATRAQEMDDLTQTTKTIQKRLDQKIDEFEERSNSSFRDVRQQLLDQDQNQNENIRKTKDDVNARLDLSVRDLRDSKTDRSELASFFTELGIRINQNLDDDDA